MPFSAVLMMDANALECVCVETLGSVLCEKLCRMLLQGFICIMCLKIVLSICNVCILYSS